ncbi:MAG TPA: dihydrodipicolinate synthase family protein, partial [Vitreimonas sp.]|nr:dihydrodipicolinate synthase family protein [Vitreimonas sp.]
MTGFRLRGLFAVLPTAFHDDGALDLPGTAAVTAAHVEAGASGLTVLGVMGEAAELSEEERGMVLAAVRASAGGRPIVLGVSGATPSIVAQRASAAADAGAAAVMVSPSL